MLDMKKTTRLVTTFDGKSLPSNLCVKFKDGTYYERGVTCFKIQNLDDTIKNGRDWQWHRIDNGLIAFNADSGEWDLITRLQQKRNIVKGIYNDKGDKGYFTFDVHKTVHLREDGLGTSSYTPCINYEVANALGYEDINYDGFYYDTSKLSKKELKDVVSRKPKAKYQFDDTIENSTKAYGANEGNKAFIKILKHYNSTDNNIDITSNDSYLSSFVREFTIGAEFETASGFVPERYCYKYGIMPLRDGSIGGYEYTTIPLFGEKGIATLRGICNVLTKRTTLNANCSFHLHLGGYEKTPESIVALYKLILMIQDDLVDMFPQYKSNGPAYLGTEKNYCKKLPQLELLDSLIFVDKDDTYDTRVINGGLNEIFKFLTAPERGDHSIDWDRATPMGKGYNLNAHTHPLDPGNQAKWNIKARYYIISLIPFIFSSKQTVEFRLHTASNNKTKVMNWLFICAAILKFAKKHQKEILSHTKFNLENVLNVYGEKMGQDGMAMSDYLIKYFKDRKSYFIQCAKNGDPFGGDLENDATYKFESKTKIDRYVNV